jgi:hypothetical protein
MGCTSFSGKSPLFVIVKEGDDGAEGSIAPGRSTTILGQKVATADAKPMVATRNEISQMKNLCGPDHQFFGGFGGDGGPVGFLGGLRRRDLDIYFSCPRLR